jgi:ABC-type polysaccharide/polyol phosphate transport system ATPase subunit
MAAKTSATSGIPSFVGTTTAVVGQGAVVDTPVHGTDPLRASASPAGGKGLRFRVVPQPALVVQDLAKTFYVPRQNVHTLKERALHPFKSTDNREYPVLRGISFEVAQGEFFGIVGRNGSGKSTLLKCMAGIYRPERGRIQVAGRMAPFIELGVGFNPDLSALDNVVINGVMMGLTPRESRRRFDEIIEFAELGDYLDMKLKNYSSGMQVRLAFAVMVQSSADVLLIDEVLAVGDAAFAQKCIDVFYRLREEGRTIVLVTHDMSAVERFCHRAMFLQDGEIREVGDPVEVGRAYLAANFAEDPAAPAPVVDVAVGNQARVEVGVLDALGHPAPNLPSGETIRVHVRLQSHVELSHPSLVVTLRDAEHNVITGTRVDLAERGPMDDGDIVELHVAWDVVLADGHYDIGILVTQGTAESDIVVDARTATGFVVHSASRDVIGVVHAPTTVEVADMQRTVGS